jgi:hypothetical protein
MLWIGSVGDDVTELQALLNAETPTSLAPLAEDGIFGPLTRARVVEFQWQNGLTPDGIVGPLTWAQLLSPPEPPGPLPIDPNWLLGYPPRIYASVGFTGVNRPDDMVTVGTLLWGAGYGPVGSAARNQDNDIGDSPSPITPAYVIAAIADLVNDAGFAQEKNITPDSALFYVLYRRWLAIKAVPGTMIKPANGSLREAICNDALANSTGLCKKEYLSETHNGDMAFPPKKDWCGMYATWVWRQANALVYFKRGDKTPPGQFGGVWRESPDQFLGGSGHLTFLAPGDIIVFQPNPPPGQDHGRNHHAVVTAVSADLGPGPPNFIDLVEGNAGSDPPTAPVKKTVGLNLSKNKEDKQYYSVDTFVNAKVRH